MGEGGKRALQSNFAETFKLEFHVTLLIAVRDYGLQRIVGGFLLWKAGFTKIKTSNLDPLLEKLIESK